MAVRQVFLVPDIFGSGSDMKSKMRLGTRKSLLAWAQSSWVARQIERLNPGVRVELCGIETQGDRIQDVPLRNVEGKEFFVAEIDEALRSREVDLTVHSMKDLSLERPSELFCAAIPGTRKSQRCHPLWTSSAQSSERRTCFKSWNLISPTDREYSGFFTESSPSD